jgi:hypothetical protein
MPGWRGTERESRFCRCVNLLTWDNRVNGKDAKWAVKNAKVDLAFLAASWTAHSDEATLNHAVDWNHWVRFPTTYRSAGL